MARRMVKLDFIENTNARKASYKKRQKGFLNKAHELNTLCGVELAIVVYSPYHEEPKVFPNHEATINTFTNFKELPKLVQSKNMETQERNTKQRIEKIENKLRKVREENKIMELTNQIYKLLNGEHIPTNMHLHDLNDLSYVINQRLKQVHDAIKTKAHEKGSTSNAPQCIAGPIVLGGTNFDRPRASLLDSVGASVSVVPLVAPSTILGGINFERPIMPPLLVTDVTSIPMVPSMAPLMVLSNTHAQVPQLKFPMVSPLKTSPQMISQRYPLIPHQMDLRRAPEMAHPIPPTTMTYPMPQPMIAPPKSNLVFPPMAPQISPPMNIPSMSASVPMDNNLSRSIDIPKSPSFSHLLSLNDDEMMTLLDFDINVQDTNHHYNNL